MSANIFGRHFAERNGYAWWGTGTRLENTDGKATTAVVAAGIDFPVTTIPLKGIWNGIEFDPGHVAVVRPRLADEEGEGPVTLGIVTPSYMPLGNYRIAEMLDPLADGREASWPVETCGALGKGEDFFITLNAGRATIAGEDMDQFFFVWNKHDGSGALRIMFTPVRVVCQNTCIMGARRANVTASVYHTKNVEAEAQFAINLTVQLQRLQRDAMSELALLPQIRLAPEQIRAVIQATYPDKPRDDRSEDLLNDLDAGKITLDDETVGRLRNVRLSSERHREKQAALRLLAFQRYSAFVDDHPSFAKTAWAVYQGITEVESHGKHGQSLVRSVMLGGERGKNMAAAYEAIIEIAGVRR